jgi:hypothetical protein
MVAKQQTTFLMHNLAQPKEIGEKLLLVLKYATTELMMMAMVLPIV